MAVDAWGMGGLLLLDAPPVEQGRLAIGVSHLAWRAPGLQRDRTWWMPALDAYATNGLFASTDYGLGWNLSRRDDVQAGVRLSVLPGREPAPVGGQSAGWRTGMRLERGLFCNIAAHDAVLLQGSLRQGGSYRRQGVMAELGVTTGLPMPDGQPLAITVGASWADRALRSSLAGDPFHPDRGPASGWHDWQLALSHEVALGAHWRLDGQWAIARLTGLHGAGVATPGQRENLLSIGVWRDLH